MDIDALFSYSPLWFLFKGFLGDVLVAVFRPLPLILPLAMIVMFAAMYAREHGWTSRDSVSQATRAWKSAFTGSAVFRIEFFLVLYVMLVMSRTMLFRPTHPHPLSDMLGGGTSTTSMGTLRSKLSRTSSCSSRLACCSPACCTRLSKRKVGVRVLGCSGVLSWPRPSSHWP